MQRFNLIERAEGSIRDFAAPGKNWPPIREGTMTHKERLLTAINHEEPDRVPMCSWYTPEAEKKVLQHLGVESNQTEMPDRLAFVAERLML